MKLVVGLGNPGQRYKNTRHNIGYDVLAALARRLAAGPPRARFQGETVDLQVENEKLLLLCPHTFMNRSGQSVRAAVDFYKIPPSNVLVVCDDFHLPLGRLRFRPQGSSGGQKGLADIIRQLGSEAFARLRFGIGPPPDNWDVADYVLSKFTPSEREEIEPIVDRAAQGLIDWSTRGIEYCMNHYNSK